MVRALGDGMVGRARGAIRAEMAQNHRAELRAAAFGAAVGSVAATVSSREISSRARWRSGPGDPARAQYRGGGDEQGLSSRQKMHQCLGSSGGHRALSTVTYHRPGDRALIFPSFPVIHSALFGRDPEECAMVAP